MQKAQVSVKSSIKKLRIAIDCDDVIVPTASLIINHYNKTYGASMRLKDLYSKDLKVWHTPDDATAVKRVDEYVLSAEYQQAEPFRDAIRVIHALADHHELHMVTGRSDFLTEATHAMVAKYFPGMFASTQLTNFFGKRPRSKAEVCRELGADLLIDDHLYHAETVAACGIEVLLFGDYPWNRADQLPSGIRRVRDWDEVARLLLPVN